MLGEVRDSYLDLESSLPGSGLAMDSAPTQENRKATQAVRRRHCPLKCTDLIQEGFRRRIEVSAQVQEELPRVRMGEARKRLGSISPPLPPRASLFSRLGSLFKCKHQEAPLHCDPEHWRRLTAAVCWSD